MSVNPTTSRPAMVAFSRDRQGLPLPIPRGGRWAGVVSNGFPVDALRTSQCKAKLAEKTGNPQAVTFGLLYNAR